MSNNRAYFKIELACFPISTIGGRPRNDLESSGKVLLSPEILDRLSRLNILFPMMFKLTHSKSQKSTHCGVLEFIADYGTALLPSWIMKQLDVNNGDAVTFQIVALPIATYCRIQPQNKDFLDISNPKAVLESSLRKFTCLTSGDIFEIEYNKKIYKLKVQETKPGDAVNITECDMEVDFSPCEDCNQDGPTTSQIESETNSSNYQQKPVTSNKNIFCPFTGSGNRLDGKQNKYTEPVIYKENISGIPDNEWNVGTIEFKRNFQSQNNENNNSEDNA